MMKCVLRIVAVALVGAVAGCERPAPVTDTTTPEITVTVSRGRGRKIFRSAEGELAPPNNCIKVPEMPTQLVILASDAGGVAFASISAFAGTIVPASVEVAPLAPESSFAIRTDRGTASLQITLTPPSPTTVRTGATAVLEIDGALPIAITASVRDYAGHVTGLSQFDLRSTTDGVRCRGDQ